MKRLVYTDEWRGLYGESWKGLICDQAFAHPAKYSRALIRKIYDHVIAEGWVSKGASVIDPFGGVALGGFDAMRHGLNWTGVELEGRFVELGGQNIALWNERFLRMPSWGTARLLQGDSRKLAEVLNKAECCVSSPPYASGCAHTGGVDPKPEYLTGGAFYGVGISSPPYSESMNRAGGIDSDKSDHVGGPHSQMNRSDMRYGSTQGQLGAMKEGDHSIAITSPPFQSSIGGGGNQVNQLHELRYPAKKNEYLGLRKGGRKDSDYGKTEGQLGAMPEGHLCVSSPPFMDQGRDDRRPQGGMKVDIAHRKKGPNGSPPGLSHFSDTDGQIGVMPPETFWSASRLILEQLHQVIVPSGHAVFVVKAFVRNKKIVDFPAQWAQLCEAVGFKLLHDHHALLTEHYGIQGGFDGDKTLRTERKSFFRRLAEKNGSPRIDHENVQCFIRV